MVERWYPAVIVAALIAAMFYALHADLSPPATPPAQAERSYQAGQEGYTRGNQAAESKTIFSGITVLDIATLILAGSTVALWIVTRRNVNIAERALIDVERAFVAVRDLSVNTITYGDTNVVAAFNIPINIINSGRTPAKKYISNHTVVIFDQIPPDFRFPDRNQDKKGDSVLGPQTLSFLPADLAIQDAVAIHEKRKVGLIYGWLEYDDIFDASQRHRTEFCFQIGLSATQ